MQFARCVLGVLILSGLALASGRQAQAQIYKAEYAEPTTRYDHGILGDAIEWGALRIYDEQVGTLLIRLPENRVFEDLEPRVVDVTGDSNPEVVVVESDLSLGARLAIYSKNGLRAATPFLGRPHRWLAPVGVGHLDGKYGAPEIAYVEKPHLTKILKVWRYQNGKLRLVSMLSGFSNHRIGEDFISGGIRDCGSGPQIITADAEWQNVMATTLRGKKLTARAVAPYSKANMRAAMLCQP